MQRSKGKSTTYQISNQTTLLSSVYLFNSHRYSATGDDSHLQPTRDKSKESVVSLESVTLAEIVTTISNESLKTTTSQRWKTLINADPEPPPPIVEKKGPIREVLERNIDNLVEKIDWYKYFWFPL